MKILTTELEGILVIEPRIFTDSRGYFYESFQAERFQQHGMPTHFVQDNVSHSIKNTVRGLHYQLQKPQGKLVFVLYGSVLDVAVDIRLNSSTFGKAFYTELSAENHRQVYIPVGFAHGFCVLSDAAGFAYKCTDYYDPSSERGVIWNDPDLMIPWPIKDALLSPKDEEYPRLKDIKEDQLLEL